MIGTEGYAPPEQYRGIADAQGDICAYGATFHHLITGSDHRGETPFTLVQRPPRRLNPAVPPEFGQLILKRVAHSPHDRYGSVDELVAALETLRGVKPAGGAVSAPNRSFASGCRLLVVPADLTPDSISPMAGNERLSWVCATNDEVRWSASQAEGAIYVGSYDANLYAIDETDGTVRWMFRIRRGVVSRPQPAADLVMFGCEDHNAYVASRQQGRSVWSLRSTTPIRSSPAMDDRSYSIGSDDGFVYRLERVRGAVPWR